MHSVEQKISPEVRGCWQRVHKIIAATVVLSCLVPTGILAWLVDSDRVTTTLTGGWKVSLNENQSLELMLHGARSKLNIRGEDSSTYIGITDGQLQIMINTPSGGMPHTEMINLPQDFILEIRQLFEQP